MTAAVAASPAVADLVLARMALPAKKRPAPAAVRKDVGKLLHGRPLSADEFVAVRDDLAAAGLVVADGRSVRLTDAGRDQALAFLGLAEFPPRTTWTTVQAKVLFPRAVGVSTECGERLAKKDQVAAFLIRRKYDLPAGSGSTLASAMEALACREAGYPEETTLKGLYEAALSKAVGSDAKLTKKELVKQLPRVVGKTPTGTADALRATAIREWLANTRPEPSPPAEFDLPTFAETVKALARVSPAADRFHDNKAFIAAVWRASQREPGFPRLSLAAFKARLVEANRADLLTLSRADLVQAMNPALVAESETEYLNATFHFVLIEGDRP